VIGYRIYEENSGGCRRYRTAPRRRLDRRGRLRPFGVGSKSERKAVWLETADQRLVLRARTVRPSVIACIEKYVGKRVKCDGMIVGYTLLAERIAIVPPDQQRRTFRAAIVPGGCVDNGEEAYAQGEEGGSRDVRRWCTSAQRTVTPGGGEGPRGRRARPEARRSEGDHAAAACLSGSAPMPESDSKRTGAPWRRARNAAHTRVRRDHRRIMKDRARIDAFERTRRPKSGRARSRTRTQRPGAFQTSTAASSPRATRVRTYPPFLFSGRRGR
jgi:hypothetical protein